MSPGDQELLVQAQRSTNVSHRDALASLAHALPLGRMLSVAENGPGISHVSHFESPGTRYERGDASSSALGFCSAGICV